MFSFLGTSQQVMYKFSTQYTDTATKSIRTEELDGTVPLGAHGGVKHSQPPKHHHFITHTSAGMSSYLCLPVTAACMSTGTAVRCRCPHTVPPTNDLDQKKSEKLSYGK